MAGGSGVKNFVTGATLLEGDLDGYLMAQAIPRFASATARDAAFTAAGLTPGEGNHAYLDDIDALVYHDGTQWRERGAELSVVKRVRAATTAALAAGTYSAGVFTETANGAIAAQDGVTLVAGDRLLVKDQVSGLQNGLYSVTQVGSAGTPFILTRCTDADTAFELLPNTTVVVSEGTTLADTVWQLTTDAPITLGTTALSFKQMSSLPGVAQGDIVYFDGSNWKILPKGSDGKVLTLASGVPSWASASSSTTHSLVRKTVDESVTSSITDQNDDVLALAIAANEVWVGEFVLEVVGNSTGGFRVNVTVPSGATGWWGYHAAVQSGSPTDGSNDAILNTAAAFGTPNAIGNSSTTNIVVVRFYVVCSSTPGNVQLQWAQALSDGTATTVKVGSHLIAHKVA